jgi:hypothetical protein
MIGPGGLLLVVSPTICSPNFSFMGVAITVVVSQLFAVPILVLWVLLLVVSQLFVVPILVLWV